MDDEAIEFSQYHHKLAQWQVDHELAISSLIAHGLYRFDLAARNLKIIWKSVKS